MKRYWIVGAYACWMRMRLRAAGLQLPARLVPFGVMSVHNPPPERRAGVRQSGIVGPGGFWGVYQEA